MLSFAIIICAYYCAIILLYLRLLLALVINRIDLYPYWLLLLLIVGYCTTSINIEYRIQFDSEILFRIFQILLNFKADYKDWIIESHVVGYRRCLRAYGLSFSRLQGRSRVSILTYWYYSRSFSLYRILKTLLYYFKGWNIVGRCSDTSI